VEYRPIPWPRRPGFVILDRNTNYLGWSVRAAEKAFADRLDVIHAEGGAGFGCAWRESPTTPPWLIHLQGLEEFKVGWLKRAAYLPLRWATRFAARRADRVVIPDYVLAEESLRVLKLEPSRSVISPVAVDLEAIDRLVPAAVAEPLFQRLRLTEGPPVLLSVGRLEANKGFDVLIDALTLLEARGSTNWVWVLVGTGPRGARLSKRVERASLGPKVRFAGRIRDDELAALYPHATLFVHPTLFEGSSLVTLEAMAHRRAVVASAAGGIPDKVTDGENGFLVPPGDAERLAAAIEKALAMGDRLRALGEAGRRRVEAGFSWEAKAKRLIDLYEEVARHRKGR
jgi:glycosyltransferase involved in cell wall biosynthesis